MASCVLLRWASKSWAVQSGYPEGRSQASGLTRRRAVAAERANASQVSARLAAFESFIAVRLINALVEEQSAPAGDALPDRPAF